MASADPTRSAARRWDVARVAWQRIDGMLDAGWEPFAVVGGIEDEDDLVYLRRPFEAPALVSACTCGSGSTAACPVHGPNVVSS